MSPGADDPRRDRAVVMARGLSSRMGVPKGLLRLNPSGPTFIQAIVALYLKEGFPVDVVTAEAMVEIYRGERPAPEAVRVLPAEPGGDTALTLLAAWRSWRAEGIACSHIWAHPVDLPLVTGDTLEMLRDHSHQEPDRVIRPQFGGTPGHPVILPGQVLADLDQRQEWHDGPLRDFLFRADGGRRMHEPWVVEVPDPGIIQDFDRPDDLGPSGFSAKNRGNP